LTACEREGSLDSAIRNPAANDFERLHSLCPELETVGFNGRRRASSRHSLRSRGIGLSCCRRVLRRIWR
jgi:G:T/U-mismatch repair DNA glycosylase